MSEKIKEIRIKPGDYGEHQIRRIDQALQAGYTTVAIEEDEDGNESNRCEVTPLPKSTMPGKIKTFRVRAGEWERDRLDFVTPALNEGYLVVVEEVDEVEKVVRRCEYSQKIH